MSTIYLEIINQKEESNENLKSNLEYFKNIPNNIDNIKELYKVKN
jgi:hypothetical protein